MGEFSKSYDWNEKKAKEKPSPEHPFSEITTPRKEDTTSAIRAYMETLAFSKEIYEKGKKGQFIYSREIWDRIVHLVDTIMLNEGIFLKLIAEDTRPQDYRAQHHLNVSLLSIEVGRELGYNKSKLCEIAVGAFLHDIGTTKIASLDATTSKFTEAEFKKMCKHPAYGVEILSKATDVGDYVVYITHEHHERLDGTGYPGKIKGGAIREYSQIVGVIDIYEAMTHWRPYRQKKFSSHEALKHIMGIGANRLEPRYVEALVNVIGLYPIDSWIELNTKEIGTVLDINRKLPLRPVVNIIYDAQGVKLAEPRVIDISKQPVTYIKKVLSEEDLKKHLSHK